MITHSQMPFLKQVLLYRRSSSRLSFSISSNTRSPSRPNTGQRILTPASMYLTSQSNVPKDQSKAYHGLPLNTDPNRLVRSRKYQRQIHNSLTRLIPQILRKPAHANLLYDYYNSIESFHLAHTNAEKSPGRFIQPWGNPQPYYKRTAPYFIEVHLREKILREKREACISIAREKNHHEDVLSVQMSDFLQRLARLNELESLRRQSWEDSRLGYRFWLEVKGLWEEYDRERERKVGKLGEGSEIRGVRYGPRWMKFYARVEVACL